VWRNRYLYIRVFAVLAKKYPPLATVVLEAWEMYFNALCGM
jgi:hypothetical protein